ncbi:MAG TPA: hypothetical protein VMY37_18725 [Thermoguttaceae bacterium]|nr:hypothetical protein [Thermoguttaceae bacterium]
MRRAFPSGMAGLFAVAAMFWITAPARAVKPFKDQFEVKYVKKKPANEKERAFAEAVAKAECSVCHEGKSKKDRNVYGRQLAKLLDKETDRENGDKIRKTLDKVAQLKSDPKVKDSPTFGELIAEGKLPGGEPKTDQKGQETAE